MTGIPQGLLYLYPVAVCGLSLLLRPWLGNWHLLFPLAAAMSVSFIQDWHIRRRRLERFAGRPDMNESDFFRTYYEGTGVRRETVSEVLRETAASLRVPSTRLRPTDRREVELGPVKGWEWDDDIAGVDWFLEDKERDAGIEEGETVETLDHMIRYVDRLAAQKKKG